VIILATAITLNNLLGWLLKSSIQDGRHLPLDIFALAILGGLWFLNKYGRTVFAAHAVMLISVLGSSLIYAVDNNSLALVYFVFPILLSGIVLKPSWSFIYAAISTLGYILANLIGKLPFSLSIEVILIYFTLAAISYLSALRFEGAVDIATRSEAQYRNLIERVPAIIYTAAIDKTKSRLYISPQVEKILGFTPDEYLADSEFWMKLIHPDDFQRVVSEAEYFYTSGEPFTSEYRSKTNKGQTVWLHEEAVILQDDTGRNQIIHGVQMDITERKQMEEKINNHLARLASMRVIDTAIMSSHDQRMIFYIILSQAIAKLGVNAASVLLLNPVTDSFEFGAAQGFRAIEDEKVQLNLIEDIGSRALKEGIIYNRHNLSKDYFLSHAPQLAGEDFTCFYVVPLISKGKIIGALEVFERKHRHHDQDWMEFLTTLAGQAAIAINNVSLFNDLQRSHHDLRIAYETTLEGWSAALDLRDRETEGHTQRVTKLTEQIAAAMGIKDDELLNFRRGALLHDIGKMGVPDKILHKRGSLTKKEWEIMRKHPQFAYTLLYPIAYLHDSLDIPYCHHEKWDGSGYPRQLKGEDIPLAARIFAIADVYDALTSDRPYRDAWSKEDTLNYIVDQSGKHFDPKIVEMFIREMTK
jgi:PAS domain S-box-containing protein